MATSSTRARGSSTEPKVDQISTLLQQALQLLDEVGDYPAMGARLQEVIDRLKQCSTS